jgi:hypothetical protein
MWRKQNLCTIRTAEAVRKRNSEIESQLIPRTEPTDWPTLTMPLTRTPPDPADVKAARETAEAQAREELGEHYKFVEMGDEATITQLEADLKVEERLNATIDKLFKRLCMLKTLRSLTSTASSTTVPRISGPKKAA